MRRLLLTEGGIIAALGGLVGCVVAVGYAWGLLELLRSWWPGTLDRSFLRLHVSWQSFLIGYFASFAVSLLTIAWAVRMPRQDAAECLAGRRDHGCRSRQGGTGALLGRMGRAWFRDLLGIGLVLVGNLGPRPGELKPAPSSAAAFSCSAPAFPPSGF